MKGTLLLVACVGVAFGQSKSRCAMISVSMDESGSMSTEQSWLPPTITQIVSGLEDEGVKGIVCITGFGSSGIVGRSLGCSFFDSSMDYASTFGSFVLDGGTEDGWHGIDFAVDEANTYLDDNSDTVDEECSDVVRMVILATDEDRDNYITTLTYDLVNEKLKSDLWILNVIVDITTATDVIGIAADGSTYTHVGGGAYATMPAGTVDPNLVNGVGTTETDYLPLAWDNFGVAWDLNRIRAGGDVADAFSSAFVDIKVREIVIQTPSPTTSAPTASPKPTSADFTTPTAAPAAFSAPTAAPVALPATIAPTMAPSKLPFMKGDPHVHTKEGRKIDIYLPLGVWSPLLAGNQVALTGHVFARANSEDQTTQWFDGIRVVPTNDTTKVLFEARIPHDIEPGTVGPDGTYVQYLRATLFGESLAKTNTTYSQPPLQVVASKLTSHVRGGRRPIYNDRLYVSTPDFDFTLENGRETNRNNFDSLEEQLAETHINLAFKRVPLPKTLTGPLAELMWPTFHETRSEEARAMTSKTNAVVAGNEA